MVDLPSRGYRGRIYLGSFLRYRPMWIKYNGGEKLTDFQVKCTITNKNIPFEKLREDKQDLLFITESGKFIPYWIESSNTTQITLWLKFPEIVPGIQVFWLYYANSNFDGASNANAVFDFFDDFESYTLGDLQGQDDWYSENYGNYYVSGSIKVQSDDVAIGTQALKGSNAGTEMVSKDIDLNINKFILEFKFKYEQVGNTLGIVLKDENGNWVGVGVNPPDTDQDQRPVYATGSDSWTAFGSDITCPSEWFDIIIKFNVNSYDYIEVNGQTTSATLGYSFSNIKSISIIDRGKGAWGRWDFVRIRKYAVVEPQISPNQVY